MEKGELKKLSRKEKEKIFIDTTIKLQKYYGNHIDNDWGEKFSFSNCDDEWLENRIIGDINIYEELIKANKNYKDIEKIINKTVDYIIPVIIIFVLLGFTGLLVFGIKQFF